DQAYEVIASSHSVRFNYTSLFGDERENDEEPVLEPELPKPKKPKREGYIVYQTALHYNYAPQSILFHPVYTKDNFGHGDGFINYIQPIYGHQQNGQSVGIRYVPRDQIHPNLNQHYIIQSYPKHGETSSRNQANQIHGHLTQVHKAENYDKLHRLPPVNRYRTVPISETIAVREENFKNDERVIEQTKEDDGVKSNRQASSSTANKKYSSPLARANSNKTPFINPHNYNRTPWRPIIKRHTDAVNDTQVRADDIVEQNKDNADEDDLQRSKRQAENGEELCNTRRMYFSPKVGLTDRSEWKYIINLGERDPNIKQVIKVDVCISPNEPCSNQISLPFGFVSRCKQKYIKKKLLALDADGQGTSSDNFFVPSCCVCEIVRANKKKK
ncbi:uncharacterized protein B4U79_08225, partial [Dinothrombium tinctorium]